MHFFILIQFLYFFYLISEFEKIKLNINELQFQSIVVYRDRLNLDRSSNYEILPQAYQIWHQKYQNVHHSLRI